MKTVPLGQFQSVHSSFTEVDLFASLSSDGEISASRVPLLAAVGGSMVTRVASRRAFFKEGRGVVTQDMIPEIGRSFVEVFGASATDGSQLARDLKL